MKNVFDVPAGDLIESLAGEFKKTGVEEPSFSAIVKTGSHRERTPQRPDWWYLRLGSILYRIYKDGPVGTGSLRTYYGGRKNRGVRPHAFRQASGKIIRLALQTLEKNGYIKKAKKGREITATGEKLLSNTASVALAGLEQKRKGQKENRLKREEERQKQSAGQKEVNRELSKIDQKRKSDHKEKEAKDKDAKNKKHGKDAKE